MSDSDDITDLLASDEDIDDLVPPLVEGTGIMVAAPMTVGERKAIYLEAISAGAKHMEAAEVARVDRSTAYRWRSDPEFVIKLREARRVCLDKLVVEAERRALHGSDRLLEFLLVNYDPARFQRATQKLEHSGSVDLVTSILAARKRSGG